MTSYAYNDEPPLGTNTLVSPPRPKGGSVIGSTGFASPNTRQKPSPYPTFGPGRDLISSQINPTPSSRSVTAQGYTGGAQSAYAGLPWYSAGQMPTVNTVGGYDQTRTQSFLDRANASLGPDGGGGFGGGGGPPGFSYSGQTTGARDITTQQLEKMANSTPDRAKLAADTYALLLERSQPQYDQGVRALGRDAAKFGRVGSQLTSQNLVDHKLAYDQMLDQSRRQLSTESAGLTLQDALDRLAGARDTSSAFASQDTAAGGLNLANYEAGQASGQRRFGNLLDLAEFQRGLGMDSEGSQVRERDTGLDNDWRRYDTGVDLQGRNENLARNRFGDFAGYEGQLANEDYRGRNEIRGERDYQYGLSRDAQGDRVNAQNAEQDWLDRLFSRGESLTDRGYQGSPADVYGQRAQQYGNEASEAFGNTGELLYEYGRRGRQRSRPAVNQYPQSPDDWQAYE